MHEILRLLCILAIGTMGFTAPVVAESCKVARISGPEIGRSRTAVAPGDDKSITELGNDLAIKALNAIGIQATLAKPEPWKRVLEELRNGKIDLVHTILKTDERSKIYAFTVPWQMDVHGLIVTSERKFPYTSVDDLDGRIGATLLGGRIPPPLDAVKHRNVRLVEASSPASLFGMLKSGRVEFVIGPIGSLLRFLRKSTEFESRDFEVVTAANVVRPVHMAISLKSPCLAKLRQLDAALEKLSPIKPGSNYPPS